jgi:hypothetical protein
MVQRKVLWVVDIDDMNAFLQRAQDSNMALLKA